MGCISFTLSQRCVNITKAISYSNCIRTRSSGDRAPPSGGGCGGSNPPRCVENLSEIPAGFCFTELFFLYISAAFRSHADTAEVSF